MQEFCRLTVRGHSRVVMPRTVEMHDGLLGVIEQLVKVAARCKHRLHHHAQREQAQQDCSKPWLATVRPNHREILAAGGRLYNSIAQAREVWQCVNGNMARQLGTRPRRDRVRACTRDGSSHFRRWQGPLWSRHGPAGYRRRHTDWQALGKLGRTLAVCIGVLRGDACEAIAHARQGLDQLHVEGAVPSVSPLRRPHSLRRRITLWLLAMATALTLAIIAQGTVVIEYVERIVWKSLLTVELDHFIQRSHDEPGYRWDDTAGFVVYVGADDPDLPPDLRGLDEGLHDDLRVGNTNNVVLVHDNTGTRYTLAMDIEQFAIDESGYELLTMIAAILLLLAIGVATAFGVSRLLRPLSRLAQHIGAMQPEQGTGRIELEPGAGSELVVIADAFNDYLARNAQFVERERTFINTASHELRTPVAVINGAAELALQSSAGPVTMQHQLQRIQRSAREMEQLITLLLALAKDPARLARTSKPLALDALLPQVVDDHQHLTEGKQLQLHLAPLPRCDIHAPPGIVRAAIGNLLRNAIENSDNGRIDIRLQDDATVVIHDPGHGMSPEQISEFYTRMARVNGGAGDSGIGLELISRLCEHFGWQLDLQSDRKQGTTAVLQLKP